MGKKRSVSIIGIFVSVLILTCIPFFAFADYTSGVWQYKTVHGAKDSSTREMQDAILKDWKIYMKEDQIVSVPYGEGNIDIITLIQENTDDSPVDIGECDKFLLGSGKDSGFIWVGKSSMLIPFIVDESSKNVYEDDACFEFELTQESIDDAEEFFKGKADSEDVGSMLETEEEMTEESESEETEADPSKPLHFELDGGILDYVGYEYANEGMFVYSDGDPDKTIIVNFDYTNKEKTPKLYSDDFWVRAYQNGVELDWPGSYSSEACPDSVNNTYSQILQDSTTTIGLMFVLKDTSPVTIIANHNGGSEVSDPMEIQLEERVDNSFDLNRIYGRWQNAETGEEVTITSDKIQYVNGGHKTWNDNPKLWTDEASLHQPLRDIGETLQIVDEAGQPLQLVGTNITLTQVESWPEGEISEEDDVVLAERQYEYYEECPALPTLNSVMDVKKTGSNKRKINNVVTEITYNYSAGQDVAAGYAEALETMGFSVPEEGGAWTIYAGNFKVGDITLDSGEVHVGIEPDAYQLTELEGGEELGEVTEIALGETITTDKETFTLQKVEILPEILPADTSGYYFSYKADPGMMYLNAEGDLYNAGKDMLCIEDLFKMTVTYGDGYTYDGFVAVDKGSDNFYEMNHDEVCAPLATCRYHFLASVPEEVATSGEPLSLTFKLSDGKNYRYDVRGGTDDAGNAVYTDLETVKKVQEALNAAGYDCGTPDGKAGPKTYAALNAYQEANGLTVKNEIGDVELSSLGLN